MVRGTQKKCRVRRAHHHQIVEIVTKTKNDTQRHRFLFWYITWCVGRTLRLPINYLHLPVGTS